MERQGVSDMDQVPSVPNLLPGPGLLNLMIWVIIDERFEPIRWSCETLIEFLSRVWLWDSGTGALKRALRSFPWQTGAGEPQLRGIITVDPA